MSTRMLSKNPVGSAPPVDEIGGVGPLGKILGGVFSPAGMAPWTKFYDDKEYVPELRWPKSIEVYNRMYTDTQVAALYRGTVLPIRHFIWSLDPNDADAAMTDKIARDLNLPVTGDTDKKQPKMRQKHRFSFSDHLRKALYAGKYGHYFFEQVGEIGDDDLWHLRKLAERPPHTIQNIVVAPDGGLVYIEQNLPGFSTAYRWGELPKIPVDRLVAYTWEQEGADWIGRSWFRECYRNWLMKDRIMRIDVLNHEKAGGIPIGIAPPGATPAEQAAVGRLAQNIHMASDAGAGLPAGSELSILHARGGSSAVDSMRYHDECMARLFLLMLLQLGQTTTGSRALGTTFVDFFSQGLTAIADWFVNVFVAHVIEDWVDWNYGPDVEPVPQLHYEFNPELAATDLANLMKAGAIVADDDLEEELRKELGLPRKGKNPRPMVQPQQPGNDPTKEATK